MKFILRVVRIARLFFMLLVAVGGLFLWFTQVPKSISAQGEVKIRQYQLLRPTAGGIVSRVLVRAGDYVHADQPLVQLDDRQLDREIAAVQHDLGEANSSLQYLRQLRGFLHKNIHPVELGKQNTDIDKTKLEAGRREARVNEMTQSYEALRSRYARFTELQKTGLISEMEVEQSQYAALEADARLRQSRLEEQEGKTELDAARINLNLIQVQQRQGLDELDSKSSQLQRRISELQAQMERLQAQHRMQMLYATMDGVIVGLKGNDLVGRRVEMGETILTIINDKAIAFDAHVPEESLVRLRAGQRVNIEVLGLPKRQFEVFQGQVELISQEPETNNPEGRTLYPVQINLERPWVTDDDGRFYLRDGMRGKAKIIYRRRVSLGRAVFDVLFKADPD